jgi:hypothetical protein
LSELPGRRHFWTTTLAVAAALFLLTELPYASGRAASPPEHRFLGILRNVDDLNMYFSFIRQAAEGHVLFEDRLTHLPHARAFFNLQFLVVGWLMRAAGSETLAFALWRAIGIVALVAGFQLLLRAARPSRPLHGRALLLFVLGGGFGWLAALVGQQSFRWDISAAFHPFAQALQNPNFSLPHGLVLVFLAFLYRGEQTGRASWYAAASAVALVEGLMRPYDLLTLWIALPVLALGAAVHAPELRATLLRLLPLLVTAPLLAYYLLLFRVHPVFKHWAAQGGIEPPTLLEHAAGWGLMGLVGAWRVVRRREHPLEPGERVLLAWLFGVVLLVHGAKLTSLLPFATQAATAAMGPVVLLSLPLLPSAPWSALKPFAKAGWAALLLLNSLSSAFLLQERTEVVSTHFGYYHIRDAELQAFDWLGKAARGDDVCAASYQDGNRIGRFVSVRVVLGHYSVTPESDAVEARLKQLLSGGLDADAARRLLSTWGVRFVYFSPREYPEARPDRWPGCRMRYRERGIAIYECDGSQESPKAAGSRPGGAGEPPPNR